MVVELRIDSTIAPGLEDLLTVGTSSFTITDADDMDQVSIAALSKTTYNEGEDVAVTVGLPSGFTAKTDITVDYELIVTTTDEDGKASAADITGPTSGSVTINEGAGTATITISLADDDVVELTELLGVRLTSASGTPGVPVDAKTTQLTILDNDVLEVTLRLRRGDGSSDETDGSELFDQRGSPLDVVLTNAPEGVSETLVLGLAARAATINDGGTAAGCNLCRIS